MKAVIIASQRSGSTFLAKCLDSHPHIYCPWQELFYQERWWSYFSPTAQRSARALDACYAREDAPVVAFKIMHNQLLRNPTLSRYIVADLDIRVIHLCRSNLLKQHASNMLNKRAREYGRPAHTTEPLPPVAIELDPAWAKVKMHLVHLLYRWYNQRLRKHRKIELVYETMIEGDHLSSEATDLVCELLEVPSQPMHADYVKMNPDNLREIVSNYGELARALAGTRFEYCLE